MNAIITLKHFGKSLSRMKCKAPLTLTCALILAACGTLPGSGFLRRELEPAQVEQKLNGIQLVDVTDNVARQILARQATRLFSESLGITPTGTHVIGPGDVIEVSIWEAPPPTLFGSTTTDARLGPQTSRVTTLPEQMVSREGFISVPFAGPIAAGGRSLPQIEGEIVERLKAKAHQPQVLARLTRSGSSTVTVVGDVASSALVPLTHRGERLLDALAAAGGARHPVNKTTIQVTRGASVQALPLETIIRDPKQNVPLHPGDVITALFQPLSFSALGATGKNEEISFEAQGITLAQALARIGGLNDARADAQGVFLFRFESPTALAWPRQPVAVTPEGRVPVIYRADLKDPRTFFVAQSFPVNDKDVLYVSNASAAELQKFLNLVFSVVYPFATATTVLQR